MYILVLESSTSSAKAMLYDTDDASCKVSSQAFRIRPGYTDVSRPDAEDVFRYTARIGRELAAGKDIAAIALGCAWHSVMLCGDDMTPATSVYLWSNTEASELCGKLRQDAAYTKEYYQKTGCMVNAIYPFFKLKLLAQQGYDLSGYRILGQDTYNTYRLTGEWAVTDAMASGTGLLDVHARAFDPGLLKELGISASQLGSLITYREPFSLNEEGAKLLGLQPGIPVIASMPDGALNQVGSGALEEGVMSLSAGTSGAVRLTASRPVIPDTPSTWCYLGPDIWLSGAATSGCCNCVDWFKHSVSIDSAGYAELDAEAERADGDTPVFLPFLFGERCPGWRDDRSGGYMKLKPSHGRKELYRAVLEGTLFNLYQCYEVLCRVNGTPRTIRLSGGITNSPFWMQMCADIFGHEIEIDDTMHASMMGAANLARHRLGLISDLKQAGSGGSRLLIPDPEAMAAYRSKYLRYLDCYNA